ncbi:MAG: phospholipase D-like domain-containing protein [Pacificimonas sp.]|jgi:phosphatidylserine/phosphatidylglycerophosphate/cardiolipin synthase-like enzyme|nr:phospholipase D-like domain-containing protein [Pacificimonas sp.]
MELEEGRNVWRVARADRFALIVDAKDYFLHAETVMSSAKHELLMIGWDVDPRIALRPAETPGEDEAKLGHFVRNLVRDTASLSIWILRWRGGAIAALFRGWSLFWMIRWWMQKRLHLKMDGAHPLGATHHQKIIVADDSFAFCGGIDMTEGRWDTREHREGDPRRHAPGGGTLSPWHDATAAMTGPAARALGGLARSRWQRAGAKAPPQPEETPLPWPEDLPFQFEDIDVGIARTYGEIDDHEPVREIRQLYIDMIASAETYIYAESQYFASRVIAEAIHKRLQEDNPPDIVLINPQSAEGWLEPIAMDSARNRLMGALGYLDHARTFRMYHPFNAGGEAIYVHAKIMVVDDRILRVGSSNLNNRSMTLDSECDVVINVKNDADRADEHRAAIRAIVTDLLAEHLDVEEDAVSDKWSECGSLVQTVESLRGTGRTLKPYERPELDGIEKAVADTEILDPEGADDLFEPQTRSGLFRGRLQRR